MILFTPNTVIKSLDVNANFTDSIDVLEQQNPYKFYAKRVTSNQTITTATWTTVALNGEDFDTNNNFNTSDYKYTVPVTGYYLLVGQVYVANADNGYAITAIVKNATSGVTNGVVLAEQRIITSSGSINKPNNCSYFGLLTAGDTITLVGYIDDTTTPTINASDANKVNTFLSGYLVGV